MDPLSLFRLAQLVVIQYIPTVECLLKLHGEIPILVLAEMLHQFPELKWKQVKQWAYCRQLQWPRRNLAAYYPNYVFSGHPILDPEMWAAVHTETNWSFSVPQVSCMWYSGYALGEDAAFLICIDCRAVERRFFDEFPGLAPLTRTLIHRHYEISPSMIRSILKCRRMWCNFCYRTPFFILMTAKRCHERLHMTTDYSLQMFPMFQHSNYDEHTEDDELVMDRLASAKLQVFSNYPDSEDEADDDW